MTAIPVHGLVLTVAIVLAQGESGSPAYVVPPAAGTHASILWRALSDPAALALQPGNAKVQEQNLADTSYVHPFLGRGTPLEKLIRRVISQDLDLQDFDMRDSLLMPVPAKLVATVPNIRGARVVMSFCAVDKAFSGPNAEPPKVVARFRPEADPGAAGPAYSVEVPLPVQFATTCKAWTECSIPLPASDAETLQLEIDTSSGKQDRTRLAVAVGNLALVGTQGAAPADAHLPAARPSPAGPNVLVIFIDAARGDCTGPANQSFPSVTPVVDILASKGVAFVNAFSLSNQTRASITAFLQSQHPTVGGFHGRWWNLKPEVIDSYYKSEPPLLPLLANRAGYTTASIGRNHFQFGVTPMALDPGFSMIYDNRKAQMDTVHIIDRAGAWMEENRDRKFFLEINISPTHQPYNPPDQYQAWTKERLKGLDKLPARVDYLSELYYADQEVGRLLSKLDSLGLTDSTVVMVTADHGETMHAAHSCNSELFQTICHNSHGLTLYDEEIHVPLVLSVPFMKELRPGVRKNAVSHLDVGPTLLQLMGLPLHPRHTGRSLLPDLAGAPAVDEEIYFEARLASGVRLEGFKYILHHEKDDARTPAWLSGPEGTTQELYNLSDDPSETHNVLARNRPKAEYLRAALRRIRTDLTDRAARSLGLPWEPAQAPPIPLPNTPAEPVPTGQKEHSSESPLPPRQARGTPPRGGETRGETNAADPSRERLPCSEGGAAMLGTGGCGAWNSRVPPSGGRGPEPRSGPEEGLAGTAPGLFFLALNHDDRPRRFGGRISTSGRFESVETLAGAACVTLAGVELSLDCRVDDDPVVVRVEVVPPGAALYFDATMDGAPLRPSNLYLGRFGLALSADAALEGERELDLSYSPRMPHFLPGFDAGLFFWHGNPVLAGRCIGRGSDTSGTGAAGPEAVEFEGAESIQDGAARSALKDLGYWR